MHDAGLGSLSKVILEQLSLTHRVTPVDLETGQWVHALGSGEREVSVFCLVWFTMRVWLCPRGHTQTTSNSRTWCCPRELSLPQVRGVLSLCLPSQQEQEVESTLRRKYTLIDKNDYAAISAVQKVSTPASCRQDSHQSFAFPDLARGNECPALKKI